MYLKKGKSNSRVAEMFGISEKNSHITNEFFFKNKIKHKLKKTNAKVERFHRTAGE